MYNLCFQKSFKKLSMINLVNIWKNTLIGGGFLSMLLGTLGASLLGSILAGRGIKKTVEGAIAKRQGRRIVKAGYGNKRQDYENKMDF